MQRKQQQKELPLAQNTMATILQSIPKEANVTKIEYEGPRIALYTNTPRYLMEHNEIISNLVNVIKKRIVVRTDESIRKSEEDARQILNQIVPKDAKMQGTFFDTATGEVSIEAKRPWLLQRNAEEFNHAEITEKIGWKLRIRKATTYPSNTIQTINYTLKVSAAERNRQLKHIGDEIFRPRLAQKFRVLVAGGFGNLKGKVFRVGCMGEVQKYHVMRTISAISSTLDIMGYKTNSVDALKTAEEKLKAL